MIKTKRRKNWDIDYGVDFSIFYILPSIEICLDTDSIYVNWLGFHIAIGW